MSVLSLSNKDSVQQTQKDFSLPSKMLNSAKKVGSSFIDLIGFEPNFALKEGGLADKTVVLVKGIPPNIRKVAQGFGTVVVKALPYPRIKSIALFILSPGKKIAIAYYGAQTALRVAKNGAKEAAKEVANEVVDHATDKAKEIAIELLDRSAVKMSVATATIGLMSGIILVEGAELAAKVFITGAAAIAGGYMTNRLFNKVGMRINLRAGATSFGALATGMAAFKLTEKVITMLST